jgi:hypothetical protein
VRSSGHSPKPGGGGADKVPVPNLNDSPLDNPGNTLLEGDDSSDGVRVGVFTPFPLSSLSDCIPVMKN